VDRVVGSVWINWPACGEWESQWWPHCRIGRIRLEGRQNDRGSFQTAELLLNTSHSNQQTKINNVLSCFSF
jgi:hypothetical protein